MRSVFKIEKLEEVEMSLTLTCPISEWIKITEALGELGSAWPVNQLSNAITDAIWHAQKHFYGEGKKEE